MLKILIVAGARPNFMKIAPLVRVMNDDPDVQPLLVHTGQHYDERMSDLFFNQLGIPEPDVNLEVGSASHTVQTAKIMTAFEPVLKAEEPDAVMVVGDVNSTIACGLVAVKEGVSLVHVEAGLRSGDRSMPEEINRVLTDAISDLLFCTEQSGVDNLLREGVSEHRVHLVGNVMIDTLLSNMERAKESSALEDHGLKDGEFAVLTLHRPSNVDNRSVFSGLLDALEIIQADMPIIFPVHPRTRKQLSNLGLDERVRSLPGIRLVDPLGYLDFLRLTSSARVVLTDSGGVQEETTVMRVPCLTLRENTERPATVNSGSNQIVGMSPEAIVAAYRIALNMDRPGLQVPPLWDGKAASRIVEICKSTFM